MKAKGAQSEDLAWQASQADTDVKQTLAHTLGV